MTPPAARPPELDESRLSPAQRAVYDRIAAGPRGAVEGPLRVWLQSPALADKAQALGRFARYESSLPPRLSELAILVTARIWSAGFEWSHHVPLAEAAGIGPEVISAIGRGEWPDLGEPISEAVFGVAVELHRDRGISPRTYDLALGALGLEGLADLVGICGYYGLISMTINGFAVPDGPGPALPEVPMAPEEMFRMRG